MTLKSLIAAVAATLLSALPAFAGDMMIHHTYAISNSPMAGAAFMVVHNMTGEDDRLIDVRSDAAQRVELHTHIAGEDGVMKMVHIEEGFAIPAEGEVVLERGGKHVMFMGLNSAWKEGDVIVLTLVFEKAGEITIEIIVGDMPTDGMMDHSSMDHSSMDHSSMSGDSSTTPSN
jgi:copper(I)-binding protein